MRPTIPTVFALLIGSAAPAGADALVWEVENPFRFHQGAEVFEAHLRALGTARGPGDVLRVERALNDPDCADRSSFDACLKSARQGYEARGRGWAA